ncbi:MAG: DNA internalization-related competence protein ComEC/Rec2 [Deltaproteobacteria bacterium]|nr:DNA internalization-related competence protein ComEC/Rec2 [Deltaproteobacteria bacterium]
MATEWRRMARSIMKQSVYASPLIPALLSYMCGLCIGLYIPGVRYAGCLVALLFFTQLVIFFRQKHGSRFVPLLFFASLGYLAIQPWVAPSYPSNHISNFVGKGPWHIKGTISDLPGISDERTRFVVEAETISAAQIRRRVCGRVRLTVRGRVSGICRGDAVAFFGRLKAPRNFKNPNGFNYERYLSFKGIRVTSYVNDPALVVRLGGDGISVASSMLRSARNRISELTASAVTDKNARGILQALLVGDRGGISPDLREMFLRSGLAHLLAISGLHVGMVGAFFFFLFRIALNRSERLLLAGVVIRWSAALTILPVIVYGMLVGMSPSTQRAVIMAFVFLTAVVFEKEARQVNTLAVAALVILIVAPVALFDISFQLSFIAVLSILFGLRLLPWSRSPSDSVWLLLSKRLATFMAVSLFAIIGTLPLVLFYFNQVSCVGLMSNCIAVPIVGFLVIPLGMLAVLILPASFSVACCVMKITELLLSILLEAVSFFSSLPYAAIKTITPSLFEIGLFYALIAALLNLKKSRWVRLTVIPCLMALILGDALFWMHERFWRQDLRVTMIDVGQGNSALLELPKGVCVLIDGGGFAANSFDVGRFVVAPFLWQKKIAQIDYIVLSHPQADHMNGLLYIAGNFHVREVWSNGEPGRTESYQAFLDILSEEKIPLVCLTEDSRSKTVNRVRFDVLHPPGGFLRDNDVIPWSNPNNNSLVLKATFGETSFLFPGDIEAEAEKELISSQGDALKSSVLLAPHHGSITSSTTAFVDHVQPDVVVFSARPNNRLRFPHPDVVRRYRTRNCRMFWTDRNGAISITTDGKKIDVTALLPGEPQ